MGSAIILQTGRGRIRRGGTCMSAPRFICAGRADTQVRPYLDPSTTPSRSISGNSISIERGLPYSHRSKAFDELRVYSLADITISWEDRQNLAERKLSLEQP